MFIGHFAVGMGSKALKPQISLGTLFIASQFLDLLWPDLLLLGLEKVSIKPGITEVGSLEFTSYPISHSLLAVLGWSFSGGLLYWVFKKDLGASVLIGVCVLSHWILDLFVHIPDLPITPGASEYVGFGLWKSLTGTLLAEGLLFTIGIAIYIKATKAVNKAGSFGFWGLIVFLVMVYLSSILGPPPVSVSGIAWGAQLQWIIIIWAYWVDKNRVSR